MTAIVMIPLFGAGLLAEYSSSAYWIRIKPDPRERMYNHIGTWLAGNTPEGASVAYLEIGRIGYFSRRRIIDLMGLVTPGVAEHVGEQDLLWALYEYKPDYYLIGSTFTWAGSPVGEPWFAEAYQKIMDFSAPDFDSVVTVYRKLSDAAFRAPVTVEAAQLVNRGIVGEILPGTLQGQTFMPSRDRLSGVAVLFATFARQNTGAMTFRLQQVDPPQTIVEQRFDMADVKDNLWREFQFPAIEGVSGKRFKLTIEAESAQPGNAMTIWYNPRDSYRRGEHLINDTPADGDLAFKLIYDPAP